MLKMLIVDDEAIHVEGIAMLVRREKLPVHTLRAGNGRDALQILKEHQVDILFTDIKMPQMDGMTLVEEALALQPDIVTIIYSSFSEFEYAQKAIRLGVTNYILKPIRVTEFTDCMNKVIRQCRKKRQESARQSIRSLLFAEAASDEREIPWDAEALPVFADLCGRKNMALLQDIRQKLIAHFPDGLPVELNEFQLLFIGGPKDALRGYISSLADASDTSGGQPVLFLLGPPIADRAALKEIYARFEEASDASFFLSRSRVLDLEQTDHPAVVADAGSQRAAEDIAGRIARGEYTGAEVELFRLLDRYASQGDGQPTVIKFLCSEIVRQSLAHRKSLDTVPLATRYVSAIYTTANLADLKAFMRSFIRSHASLKNQPDDDETAIRQILQFIEEKYMNDISLETIAEKVFLSPSYVSYLFKKETGQNFMKYLTEFRINKAKVLLRTTNEKVTYICKAVGYNNVSYFCMIFRNYCGVTPAQYREQSSC